MICEERLLKIIRAPLLSEKVSATMKKHNTIVLKVVKDATKEEIKTAVYRLFKVEVYDIHTLIVKGKTKYHKQRVGHRSNWKKAYVSLKEGQDLDFISGME